MNETVHTALPATTDSSMVTYAHIIYALHALSVVIGLTSAATVVGAFIFGLPSIIGVIMNYVKQSAVRGTWLASHFRWQIRTFWFAFLWIVVVTILSFPLVFLLGLGILTYYIGVIAIGLWLAYRVIRGWMALRERRPMYEGA